MSILALALCSHSPRSLGFITGDWGCCLGNILLRLSRRNCFLVLLSIFIKLRVILGLSSDSIVSWLFVIDCASTELLRDGEEVIFLKL
jgi:hypothetical protein